MHNKVLGIAFTSVAFALFVWSMLITVGPVGTVVFLGLFATTVGLLLKILEKYSENQNS